MSIPKHILNHPERRCTRCGLVKPSTQFSYYGFVCSDCKHCAKSKLLARRKSLPKPEKLRTCKRCGKIYTVDKFAPNGKVCYQCKIEALAKSENRNKYHPASAKKWVQNNPEKRAEHQKRYRDKCKTVKRSLI